MGDLNVKKDAPKFGWLTELVDMLNKSIDGKWMFTGSFAMFCYAHLAGLACREPADIDIIVAKGTPPVPPSSSKEEASSEDIPISYSDTALFDIVKLYKAKVPTMGAAKVTGCNINKIKINVDVRVEGSDVGMISADLMKITVKGKIYPLVSATKLLSCKEKVVSNRETRTEKHEGDLELMRQLVKLQAPSSETS